MSYLGRSVDAISNVEKLDNITFDGSTSYALTKSSAAFTPAGKNNILISISGVVQQGNFSVSGSNIVFDSAVAGTETCDFIMHYGTGLITTPADDTVSSSKIQTNAITSAKILNDAVTKDKTDLITDSNGASVEAKGSSGYQGAVRYNCENNSHYTELKSAPHGSYSGNISFTLPSSTGTNGQFLQTNGSGALSFADVSSGLWVKLGDTSYNANTSSITFDNVFSSTYKVYKVHMKTATSNSNENVKIRLRSGSSGSNADINDSNYNYKRWFNGQDLDDGGNSYNRSNGRLVTYFELAANGHTGANHKPMQIDMTIQDPGDHHINNSGRVNFTYMADFYNSSNLSYTEMGSCFYNGNTDATGITFEMTAGSYGYGNILLYGLKP